jgi:hypothetical protein
MCDISGEIDFPLVSFTFLRVFRPHSLLKA